MCKNGSGGTPSALEYGDALSGVFSVSAAAVVSLARSKVEPGLLAGGLEYG
jgi:hypothetical protein